MHQGVLIVNGESIPEKFAHHADLIAEFDVVVPFGKVFVLGDNRPISCDSRSFGMVDSSALRGKVRACFWPLNRMTFL